MLSITLGINSNIILGEKENETGIELSCKRCEHMWLYTGKNDYISFCPNRKTRVTVTKRRNKESLKKSLENLMRVKKWKNGLVNATWTKRASSVSSQMSGLKFIN